MAGDGPILLIRPSSFADACAFVERVHRHHSAPQGHKFSLAVHTGDGRRVGVAIVGRPVARAFDDGLTLSATTDITSCAMPPGGRPPRRTPRPTRQTDEPSQLSYGRGGRAGG